MEITVQWVRTSWTKRSRGGPGAARRNAAPPGFAVPCLPPSTAHVVRMDERDGFAPHHGHDDVTAVDVRIGESAGRLRVLPRVPQGFGLPPRPRRRPAVRLAPGQWVRWRLNYRCSSAAGMQDWSYWLDTFNIAYGPVEPETFLAEPTVLVDEQGPVR